MAAKRERFDPLRYADRGIHRLRPREIEELRRTAERAGTPLSPAALAFLASDQEALGMGDDGKLWVREAISITKFPPERVLDAARHAWKVWRKCGRPVEWTPWLTDTMHRHERARRGLPDPWD